MNIKIIIILLSIAICSCYDVEKYLEKKNSSSLPKVTLSPSIGLRANGVDSLTIKVTFEQMPSDEFSSVTFSTTEGIFVDNSKSEYTSSVIYRDTIDQSFYALALLKSTLNAGEHILTVNVPNLFKKQIPIKFLPSYPEFIRVDKSKFSVATGFKDEILLFANATAAKGLPNKGTLVEFSVESYTPDNSNLFRSLTKTDEKGQASVYFTPGLFNGYTGPIKYSAKFTPVKGDVVSSSGTFEIVTP